MARRYRDMRVDPQARQSADLLGQQVENQQTLTQVLRDFTNNSTAILGRVGVEQAQTKGTQAGLTGQPQLKGGINKFTKFGRAYNDAARQAYVAKTNVDVEDTYSRIENESPTNVTEYEAKSEGYRKGLLSSIEDPQLKAEMDFISMSRAAEGRRRIADAQLSVERDQQRTDILDGLDVMVQSAARKVSQDGQLPEVAFATLEQQINETFEAAKAVFTPAQIRELKGNYLATAQKGMQSQQVSNLASKIMGKFEADMLAGTAAMKALDNSGLDDETRIAVQSEVRKRLGLMSEQRKRQHLGGIAALNKDIADGEPEENAEQEAFGLWRKGAISEEAYSGYVSQIERARVENAKETADLEVGLDAWKRGVPLDPKDAKVKTMMDKVFKQAVAGVPRGTPEWQNAAIDMMTRTNVLPTDAMSWSRTIIASGDMEQSAPAAAFLARAERANPTGFLYVDDDQLKAYVGQVNSAIDAGTPSDVAIQLAHKNTYGMKDSERQAFKAMYSKRLKGPQKAFFSNSGDLQSRLDSDDRYDRAWFSGAPEAPAGLKADYDSGVERYFPLTGGDLDQARELAWRDVQRKWGYSTVNGEPQLMPYAPESMYPQIPMEVIKNDLSEVGKSLGIESPRLVPSPDTASTAGLEWNIGKVNEFGTTDILLGPDKRPYRYALPTDTGKVTALRDQRANEEIAKARQFSADQRAMNERIARDYTTTGDPDLDAWLIANPNVHSASQIRTSR